MFFSVARCGLCVRLPRASRDAVAAGESPTGFCENRQARFLATAQDDAETVETGLGGGQTGGRLCRIKNLANGARGEIELGTVCPINETIMRHKLKAWIGAFMVVSVIDAITCGLCYVNFDAVGKWLLCGFFLGATVFAITIYFSISDVFWKRLFVAICYGIFLSIVWLFGFGLIMRMVAPFIRAYHQ